MHLELYDLNTGKLIKSLTNGEWIVQSIIDIDEDNSNIYFLANRETPLEYHLYSVNYKDDKTINLKLTFRRIARDKKYLNLFQMKFQIF